MAKSYVAGVLQGIKNLQSSLQNMPTQTAYALLQSCIEDEPTPPWDSGDLRNSGAAYVGSRLVATGDEFSPSGHWGQNPTPHPSDEKSGRNTAKGATVLSTFRSREREGATLSGAPLASTRNTVSVVFRTDHADAMHNGKYRAREPGSGPLFISSKLATFGYKFTEIARHAISNSIPSSKPRMFGSAPYRGVLRRSRG